MGRRIHPNHHCDSELEATRNIAAKRTPTRSIESRFDVWYWGGLRWEVVMVLKLRACSGSLRMNQALNSVSTHSTWEINKCYEITHENAGVGGIYE